MIDTAQAYHNEEGVGNTIRKSDIELQRDFPRIKNMDFQLRLQKSESLYRQKFGPLTNRPH